MNLEREMEDIFKEACRVTSALAFMIVRRKFSATKMQEVADVMRRVEEKMRALLEKVSKKE